jgi:5-methylcytosine-specific restriction enzyme A
MIHRDVEAGIKKERSPHWHKVEKDFLAKHTNCAACGTNHHLQVHHIKPFHLYPEHELDESNLITLCMEKECHLKLGHGGDWKAYNPNVLKDVDKVHNHVKILNEVAEQVKLERVYI